LVYGFFRAKGNVGCRRAELMRHARAGQDAPHPLE
jgi:hypothetical protein